MTNLVRSEHVLLDRTRGASKVELYIFTNVMMILYNEIYRMKFNPFFSFRFSCLRIVASSHCKLQFGVCINIQINKFYFIYSSNPIIETSVSYFFLFLVQDFRTIVLRTLFIKKVSSLKVIT